MKKIILITALLIGFSGTVNAQFFKKLGDKLGDAVENAVERKAKQKTTKETEKAFDSTFNRKRKKNKRNSKTPKKSGGIFGQQAADTDQTYTFIHTAEMEIITNKETINVEYHLPENSDYFAMKMIDKRMKDDVITVMDIKRNGMFTFMNTNGAKMKMGIAVDATNTDDATTPTFQITATGQTKTILGYHCKQFKMKGDNITADFWVTKDVNISFPKTMPSSKNSRGNTQDWMKNIEGWAMEMTMTQTVKNKLHTTKANCLSIGKSNLVIQSSEYKTFGY